MKPAYLCSVLISLGFTACSTSEGVDLSAHPGSCERFLFQYFLTNVTGTEAAEVLRFNRSIGSWSVATASAGAPATELSTLLSDGFAGAAFSLEPDDWRYGSVAFAQRPPWATVGDLNGDERADALVLVDAEWYLAVSNGSGFDDYTSIGAFGESDHTHLLANVGGSEDPDLIDVDPETGTWTVGLWDPDAGLFVESASPWATDFGVGAVEVFAADVGGPGLGLADAVFVDLSGTWYVAASDGEEFTADAAPWASDLGPGADRLVGDVGGGGLRLADVAVHDGSGGWTVGLSDGSAFSDVSSWATGLGADAVVTTMGSAGDDVNGLQDLLLVTGEEEVYVSTSEGDAFSSASIWRSRSVQSFPADVSAGASCDSTGSYDADTPTCGGLSEAYTHGSVNVAYYPMQVRDGVATWELRGAMRGEDVSVDGGTLTDEDLTLRTLDAGDGFGAQSEHNADCESAPLLREPRAGYAFGYSRASNSSGWVPTCALEFDLTETSPADGPARDDPERPEVGDFEVQANPYGTCSTDGLEGDFAACEITNDEDDGADCDGTPASSCTAVVTADDLYLRWAAGSTARRYLMKGDEMEVLLVGDGWAFVAVTASSYDLLTPVGSLGWVQMKGSGEDWISCSGTDCPSGCP